MDHAHARRANPRRPSRSGPRPRRPGPRPRVLVPNPLRQRPAESDREPRPAALRDGGRPKVFAFRHHAPLGGSDALDAAFDRVLTALTDRVQKALPSQPWSGAGWEYDTSGLTFGAGRGRQSLADVEIAAVDMLEGNLCAWAAGETMPCLRVPADSPGALVLGQLLARRMRDRPRVEDESTE